MLAIMDTQCLVYGLTDTVPIGQIHADALVLASRPNPKSDIWNIQ